MRERIKKRKNDDDRICDDNCFGNMYCAAGPGCLAAVETVWSGRDRTEGGEYTPEAGVEGCLRSQEAGGRSLAADDEDHADGCPGERALQAGGRRVHGKSL